MATSSEVMESDPVNTLREECLQLKESIKTERAKYKDTSCNIHVHVLTIIILFHSKGN